MSRFYFGSNKAALFFAMALLPSGIVYSQTKKDTVQKEKKIEEVIVIGYGTQKKEAVTGSVSSLSGSALKEVPAANITEALQGRLPGVEISQISTKPGAEQQIRIRGTRSLSADNNPLIVLDGIPFAGSISDINPNDIKSLDVLKDASATAIYGSRGANGVIIVTTNRGNKNQKARFSYNGYTGVQTLFAKYPLMDATKLQKLRQLANMYATGGNEVEGVNTDWQDLYYGTGTITSHDVGVTGGTNGGGYSAGIAYFKQEGVVPLQYYQRLSMKMSLDQQVGELFKFGFTSNNNFSVNNANGLNAGNVLQFSPLINPYNSDGTPRTVVSTVSDQMWAYTRQNLESLGDAYIDRTKSFGSYNNLYGEFNFPGIQGLKYRLNVGLNYKNSNGGGYTGIGVFNTNPAAVSSANISNSSNIQWVLENLLTYDRTFGKHKINAIALYSAEQQTYNSSYIRATDVPIDAFQFYNLGQAQGEIIIDPAYQNYYKRGLMSWMGRVMYQYDNRYMLTATVRSDGASVLAPGHKWHTYPAVSVGWNATNESFLKDIKNVDLIKFRAGYGQTSNQSVGPYSTLGRLTTLPYNFGSSNAIGNYVTTLPNSDLGWEYSKTQNYGVDFGFFGNRLTGTVEYYKTETKDILLAKNLPYTSGVSSVVTNIGATENKGIEISLNGTIFSSENFSWDVGVNWYKNRNKIVALNSGQEKDEANLWFVGHNINSLYDYHYVGLWQNGDPYLQVLEPGGNVGMIKVLYTGGYKADGTPERAIGVQDRQIIDTDPDWQGGFSTKWRYKNFDLSVVGAYQHGGVLISTLYGSSSYLNMLNGRRGQIDVDYWTEENPNVRYPKPGGISTNDNPKYSSTLGYFDGSYLKIRTITLGYNFNKSFLETLKITSLRLYATVTNPFVMFSPYYKESGMDPEPNSRGDENQAVTTSYKNRFPVVGATNPSTRNFLMGINLTF
jgi:TonB-linked SusC/RagA family outer membrane protein